MEPPTCKTAGLASKGSTAANVRDYLSKHKLPVITRPKVTNNSKTALSGSSTVTNTQLSDSVCPGKSRSKCKYRQTSIETFPDEILFKIFKYLPILDLLTCSLVNKHWCIIATDNLLWQDIYHKYVGLLDKKETQSCQEQGYWKKLCISKTVDLRNHKVLSLLRKVHLYTGLVKNTEAAIRKAGITWRLCLGSAESNSGKWKHCVKSQYCHELHCQDMFFHSMSVVVCFSGYNAPPLNSINTVHVFSINPIFFHKDGRPVLDGPHQKSLLLEISRNFDWSKQLSVDNIIGSDNIVTLHHIPLQGLLFATWKEGGELSFIVACFHFHKLVQRCLLGTSSRPYIPSFPNVLEDDIDPTFGLHHYQLTLELSGMQTSYYLQHFNGLQCQLGNISEGHAHFIVIKPENSYDYTPLSSKLNLSWKTDSLKGVVQDVCLLHITVLEEREEIFWSVSTPVRYQEKKTNDAPSFDLDTGCTRYISYKDDRGQLYMEMNKCEDGRVYVTNLQLSLSLDAVNQWFGTSYT
ncbi:F-box only protein 15-like [Octopus vulgaris]|uniref:F-box only protein 15-like n=1 Tax=Octopus vulgaris TaxID=6645 RepID=A0AA36BPH6_OCTVU|nr:F-box only protein 15-like [Octopus vulgaris]